jgi:hypothetical protein
VDKAGDQVTGTRESGAMISSATRAGSPVRVLWGALIVAALYGSSAQPSQTTDASEMRWKAPSPNDNAAWRWATAAPGMNIYVSYRYARREGSIVTAWIDREYYRNPAGIDKSIIELRQFDCARMTTRWLSDVAVGNPSATWQRESPGSPVERVAAEVCVKMNAQVLEPEDARG